MEEAWRTEVQLLQDERELEAPTGGRGHQQWGARKFPRAQQKVPGGAGVGTCGQKRGCTELCGDQSLGTEGNLGAPKGHLLE